MCKKKRKWAGPTTCSLFLGAFGLAGLLFGAQAVYAVDSGPTVTGDVCMQHVFGDPVTNSNTLNCTANDIRLSGVSEFSPSSCIEGSTFTLTAKFEVDVTANARYDAGFFFRIDGGLSARGDGPSATGSCSLSALDNPPKVPGLNLDSDTCGDLNAGTTFATFTIPGVSCVGVADPQNPGKKILRLPNCTSWHSNQGTSCNIANPLDFEPDTKSKCVCDDNFTVPVLVESAALKVVKSANPTTVAETGGTATYTVDVKNEASFVSVTITTLTDDIYGNIGAANGNVTENSCPDLVGDVLAPGASTVCSFKAFVSGDTGQVIKDIVEVCGTQNNTGATICGKDDAEVTIIDVPSTPSLAKTAQSASCEVSVRYQVVVSNNSTIDTLTVDELNDDKFGNITLVQGNVVNTNCSLPQSAIAPLGNFTCEFVGKILSSDCSIDHTNTVTAKVTDDDAVKNTLTDSATVKVVTTTP
jgi:hypothetical protein